MGETAYVISKNVTYGYFNLLISNNLLRIMKLLLLNYYFISLFYFMYHLIYLEYTSGMAVAQGSRSAPSPRQFPWCPVQQCSDRNRDSKQQSLDTLWENGACIYPSAL